MTTPAVQSQLMIYVHYAGGEVRKIDLAPDAATERTLRRAGFSKFNVYGTNCSHGGVQVDPTPSVYAVWKLDGLAVANHCPSIEIAIEPGPKLRACFGHRMGSHGPEGAITTLVPDTVAIKPIWDAMRVWHEQVLSRVFPREPTLSDLTVASGDGAS